jgi:hypothetical protein
MPLNARSSSNRIEFPRSASSLRGQTGRDYTGDVGTGAAPNVITLVLPQLDEVLAAIPPDFAGEEGLEERARIAFLSTQVSANPDDLEAAVGALRARAGGASAANPFGPRIQAKSFAALADAADRIVAAGRLDLATVLALQYQTGYIAATEGRRLLLFLGLNAAVRRIVWELGSAEIRRRDLGQDDYVELGRWILLWTEMSSLSVTEGYRAAEREFLARDAAARRAALDELLGSSSTDGRAATRLWRLAMRYGLDPDAAYRLAAILPGADADPTPDEPGFDEADLEAIASRIDHLLRRPTRYDETPGAGIRLPLALTWRGVVVALLGPDAPDWQRLQSAIAKVLGNVTPPTWIAIAVRADGVRSLAPSLIDLQEGLRVAAEIGRRGIIEDLGELGVERLLLSDPGLASVIVERELGPLLSDKRMGEELIETVQVFFDVGENRRETARRMHLADRTVAYRLDRAEELLGHGLEGEPGRRLNVALTLRRLQDSRRQG